MGEVLLIQSLWINITFSESSRSFRWKYFILRWTIRKITKTIDLQERLGRHIQKWFRSSGFKYERRTEPFRGASGVTHPVLSEAVNNSKQAYKELLPAEDQLEHKL